MRKGPLFKISHGRILISWNPILYSFYARKSKSLPWNIFSLDACSSSICHLTTYNAANVFVASKSVSSNTLLNTFKCFLLSVKIAVLSQQYWHNCAGGRGEMHRKVLLSKILICLICNFCRLKCCKIFDNKTKPLKWKLVQFT